MMKLYEVIKVTANPEARTIFVDSHATVGGDRLEHIKEYAVKDPNTDFHSILRGVVSAFSWRHAVVTNNTENTETWIRNKPIK